ncbi:hypothetical protein RLEG12_08280 (plasmid) [Rhizobium leguminosarum bv. trifolii CB782]|nr:hypothetical protein RLEG12_08280 [Rhizobium leguminosarum bv. trifolii CB782]
MRVILFVRLALGLALTDRPVKNKQAPANPEALNV